MSGKTVLLLHTLPDGASHHDWLLERRPGTDPDEGRLLALRTPARPDAPETNEIVAERMPDHRALYLDYEGPVRDIGSVRRLAAGSCVIRHESEEAIELTVDWGAGPASWRGDPLGEDRWRFWRTAVSGGGADRR